MNQRLKNRLIPVSLMLIAVSILLVACASMDSGKQSQETSQSSAEDGRLEQVIVTGNRETGSETEQEPVAVEPEAEDTDQYQEVVVSAQKRPSNFRRSAKRVRKPKARETVSGSARSSAGAMSNVAPSLTMLPPSGQQTTGFYAAPDEEVWIIAKAKVSKTNVPVTDDASPGSGAMLARLIVDPDDVPQPEPQDRPMPLKHSDVRAQIQGYISTVDVTQQFHNPFSQKIEAVYMFPLPEKSAVNEFVMTIGERKIRGILREKKEATRLYNEARSQGYQASLMTQHRPNVFEQKVANIEPGHEIDVSIRYFHTLSYRDGWYSFVFPTVVGPRFNPPGFQDPIHSSNQHSQPATGSAVHYLRPGERSGHDISIAVDIDAGVALEEVKASHQVVITPSGSNSSNVSLAAQKTIPNQDFVLSFRVAGEQIKSNLLTYQDPKTGDGYFTLMVYPPADLKDLQRQSMEMVFVIDASGSMSGEPMKQAKAAILSALEHLTPSDTFQIIRFSDNASHFGPKPVPATRENISNARRYVKKLRGQGGTMMIEGVKQALDFPHDTERFRLVTFLTDGFIGNDREIIGEVSKRIGRSRIFSFGVGSSVNRFLLERMASEGRGAASFLSLDDSASDLMNLYFNRISHPAMTDININWGSMGVSEVYPRKLPDLFVGRPVVVTGKYQGDSRQIGVNGRAGQSKVDFAVDSTTAEQTPAIASVWARRKIADLNDQRNWDDNPELIDTIRDTALAYQLMSDFTSFVAVDASVRTAEGYGTTVHQAVPVPKGVRYETTVEE